MLHISDLGLLLVILHVLAAYHLRPDDARARRTPEGRRRHLVRALVTRTAPMSCWRWD